MKLPRSVFLTRQTAFLVALLGWIGSLSGCQPVPSEDFVIGFSQCIDSDDWRQAMLFEMEKELAFHSGVRLIYKNADGNSAQQIRDIRALQQAGIDLLIVSPNEANPITPAVEEVYQSGIPVIVIDRKILSADYTAYVGADNYEIGHIAGNYAAELLPEGGRVLEVTGLPGSTPAQERHRGFTEVLRAFPQIQLLDSVNGEWERRVAKRKLQDTLASYDTIDLIFAHNDMMALATHEVIQQHPSLKNTKLLGINGLSGPNLGIDLVNSSVLDATFLYPTGGDKAIQVALDILEGRPYRKENILQTTVIDPSNVKVIKLQSDKIAEQQQDIVRQQRAIQEQLAVYRSQQSLLYVVAISLAIALALGAYALYSLREKQVTNRRLRVQNDKITHQRNQMARMAQETEAAHQAKFSFFTNISHEFRTPLTLILASIEDLLEEDVPDNPSKTPAVRHDLLLMRKNASRLLRLINQLLDFRRLEHNKIKVVPSSGDIVAFLREVVTAFERTAQRRQITYRFVALQPSIEAYFDASMLDKVFFNLLSNAFKFTPDGGSIKVLVEREEDRVHIQCIDNGQGMSDEHAAHAFDTFYQGDQYRARGTGLGLSLSKELIECHGGTISVTSEKGQGSCFNIILPLHVPNEPTTPDDPTVPSSHQYYVAEVSQDLTDSVAIDYQTLDSDSLEASSPDTSVANVANVANVATQDTTILIIEDHEDLRSFLARKFRTTYHVITSEDGTDGLKQAFAHMPDLVVCDIMLPGQDGLTIAHTLKNDLRTSHIPIILLTARTTPEQQLAGLRTGVDAYVTKPFHPKLLVEQVSKLLWNREQLRQRFASTQQPSEPLTALPNLDQQFLQCLTDFIQQNLAEPELNVNAVAQEVGLSRVHLYRKVKALLGMGINDYIKVQRLQKARKLLPQPDLTIAEVAYAVGFSSPAYFSTVFKSYYQQSPSDFVKNPQPVS